MEIRANGYRVIRYFARSIESIETCWNNRLEIALIRSLCRDGYEVEREQAIKFVRMFVDQPTFLASVPKGVFTTLVSSANLKDDTMQNIAIETLCELAVRDPRPIVSADGLKSIFQIVSEGKLGMAQQFVQTMCFLLDKPHHRRYLRSPAEIENIFSIFTDTNPKTPNRPDKLETASEAIAGLFKTWPGMLYLFGNCQKSISCFLESLKLPNEDTKLIILNTIFKIFRLPIPSYFPELISAPKMKTFANNESDAMDSIRFNEDEGYHDAEAGRVNLLKQHLAVLLVQFIDLSMFENLIYSIENGDLKVASRAVLLVGELLKLCYELLPIKYSTKVQTLPRLFYLASSFRNEHLRHHATNALAHIDRILSKKSDPVDAQLLESKICSLPEQIKGMLDRDKTRIGLSDDIKGRFGAQIDESTFRSLLNESQVLLQKEHEEWDWEIIGELLDGPLLNPKRMDDLLKNTKFFKRLLAFYRPRRFRFSDIKKGKNTSRYIKCGCSLLQTLLGSLEGLKLLLESEFLEQLSFCIAELNPAFDLGTSAPFFTRDRLQRTLSAEYFLFIGVLVRDPLGEKVLENFHIFDYFYKLAEHKTRDDVIKLMLSCLDYSTFGHSRILLSKVMQSGYKSMRIYATNFCRHIMRSNVCDFKDWGIPLLVEQMYDPDVEVCERAIMAMDEACQVEENLKSLISCKPKFMHLQELAAPIYMRMLEDDDGFQYLYESGYIQSELDYWEVSGCEQYVIQSEIGIQKSQTFFPNSSKAFNNKVTEEAEKMNYISLESNGFQLTHFYGQLAQTKAGMEELKKSHVVERFVELIDSYIISEEDFSDVIELKSAIWSLGNIASVDRGLEVVQKSAGISKLIHIALKSKILSLKGTAVLALGLISTHERGKNTLDELGWCSTSFSSGNPGICIPEKLQTFIYIPQEKYKPHINLIENTTIQDPEFSEELKEIVQLIGNLSNHILSNASSKTLARKRYENPDLFMDDQLYIYVTKLIGNYNYRMNTRRYILFDLFGHFDQFIPIN